MPHEAYPKRLLTFPELITFLNLPDDSVEWLVDTRQLSPLTIHGHVRFDSRDVTKLIETYKLTQQRRTEDQ